VFQAGLSTVAEPRLLLIVVLACAMLETVPPAAPAVTLNEKTTCTLCWGGIGAFTEHTRAPSILEYVHDVATPVTVGTPEATNAVGRVSAMLTVCAYEGPLLVTVAVYAWFVSPAWTLVGPVREMATAAAWCMVMMRLLHTDVDAHWLETHTLLVAELATMLAATVAV
jgi:hypothetical protein